LVYRLRWQPWQEELVGSVVEQAREARRNSELVARLGEQVEQREGERRGPATVVTRRPPRVLLPSLSPRLRPPAMARPGVGGVKREVRAPLYRIDSDSD